MEVMVIDALVSGMRINIANESGLACVRLGTNGSRLNQERVGKLFGNCLHSMAIVAVICFMDKIFMV